MNVNEKLAAIAALVTQIAAVLADTTAVQVQPVTGPEIHPNHIELAEAEVVIDGMTVNPDGSKWAKNPFNGKNERIEYGFISEAKNPETWRKLRAAFGPEMWDRWLGQHQQWGIYKVDPGALVATGTNAVTLAYLLQTVVVYRPIPMP